MKSSVLIDFAKISLKGYNLWDDELNNAAVRDDQNKDHADEDIAYSYKKDGWLYSSFPPIISTDGSIKDGRTRIRAALLAGWDSILVAIFSYDDEKVNPEFASNINDKHQSLNGQLLQDVVELNKRLEDSDYVNIGSKAQKLGMPDALQGFVKKTLRN